MNWVHTLTYFLGIMNGIIITHNPGNYVLLIALGVVTGLVIGAAQKVREKRLK